MAIRAAMTMETMMDLEAFKVWHLFLSECHKCHIQCHIQYINSVVIEAFCINNYTIQRGCVALVAVNVALVAVRVPHFKRLRLLGFLLFVALWHLILHEVHSFKKRRKYASLSITTCHGELSATMPQT